MGQVQTQKVKGYVVGRTEAGLWIDVDGQPQANFAKAEVHKDEIVARLSASRRSQMGQHGAHWKAMPIADVPTHRAEPDDDRYSEAEANEHYASLRRRAD